MGTFLYQQILQLMNNEELPEYKQTFLREMQELRQQKLRGQFPQQNPLAAQQPKQQAKIQNNIINTAQYSSSNWRQTLTQSSYNRHHDSSHYELNLLMNPEIAKKKNNIQLTPISEYSNAMHNKTVFVNPKNISC